jgi:membrane protease YdiL (CAAX protease family)
MKFTVLVTLTVGAALALAFRESAAHSTEMWLELGGPYLVLSGIALWKLARDGVLREALMPRAGDFSIGSLIAGVLWGGGWLVRHFALTVATAKITWLFRISFQLGFSASPGLLAIVVCMALFEELVWRGLVLTELGEVLGTRRAWPVATLVYGAAHLPTVFVLADPLAGKNPVLVLAALGCGLVWNFAATMLGRLTPLVISHAIFSYFAFSTLLPHLG